MSAHDTVRGHSASSRALMVSMTPNPLSEPALGPALFSPVKLPVSSSRTDASQPWRTYTGRHTTRHMTRSAAVHEVSSGCCGLTCLHEAVVEVEPEQGGAHAAVQQHGSPHGGVDGDERGRARRGVERRRQLSPCGGHHRRQRQDQYRELGVAKAMADARSSHEQVLKSLNTLSFSK
jgi:hypothetical protein